MKNFIKSTVILCSLVIGFVMTPLNVQATNVQLLIGDINGDGEIAMVDLAYLQNFLSGRKATANDYMSVRLDVNLDYVISKEDRVDLAQRLADNVIGNASVSLYDSEIPFSSAKSYNKINALTGSFEKYYTLNALSSIQDESNGLISNYSEQVTPLNNDSNVPIVTISSSLGTYSGFIVGENEILTSAHCLYDTLNNVAATNVTYSIYEDSYNDLLASGNAECYHVPNMYINSTNRIVGYDYAIIKVHENIGDYGVFDLGIIRKKANILNRKNIIIGGRISSDYASNNHVPSVLRTYISRDKITDYAINYESYSLLCSEGGPILTYTSNGERVAIGIHSDCNYRIARRIDSDILQFVYNNEHL